MEILNYEGGYFNVDTHIAHRLQGYGNWKLTVTCTYKNNTKLFTCHTTDSMFIDEINDMRHEDATYQEVQDRYIKYVGSALDEQLLEWIYDIEEGRQ